uniref:NADH dehydrogenase subunit 4L n=1 Tax=Rhotana formosana TaxID=3081105 RepID=UPI002A803F81|nr:NADH dehydrogenase subunit 4L [Rhotana formosana]WOW99135.1 NADH dehydrogenase subunit 4L [Rhotana formosana]
MDFILFFFGFLTLILVRKHYFLSLLSLEFILVYLFISFFFFLNFYGYDFYFCVIFLVLGICDGVLGLSLLVYLVRKINSDYFVSLFSS